MSDQPRKPRLGDVLARGNAKGQTILVVEPSQQPSLRTIHDLRDLSADEVMLVPPGMEQDPDALRAAKDLGVVLVPNLPVELQQQTRRDVEAVVSSVDGPAKLNRAQRRARKRGRK